MLATLSRSRSWVQIPSGTLYQIQGRNSEVGIEEPLSELFSDLRPPNSQLAKARSSIGQGSQSFKLKRWVRFPYELLVIWRLQSLFLTAIPRATFELERMVQTSWDSVGFHKAESFGSIPKSATRRLLQESLFFDLCGWASAQPSLISLDCRGATPGSAILPSWRSGGVRKIAGTSVYSIPNSDFPPLNSRRSGTQTGKAVTLRAWRFCGFDSHSDHSSGMRNAECRMQNAE